MIRVAKPSNTPSNGLETANQKETFQPEARTNCGVAIKSICAVFI